MKTITKKNKIRIQIKQTINIKIDKREVAELCEIKLLFTNNSHNCFCNKQNTTKSSTKLTN